MAKREERKQLGRRSAPVPSGRDRVKHLSRTVQDQAFTQGYNAPYEYNAPYDACTTNPTDTVPRAQRILGEVLEVDAGTNDTPDNRMRLAGELQALADLIAYWLLTGDRSIPKSETILEADAA